jgi:hypothetical protein
MYVKPAIAGPKRIKRRIVALPTSLSEVVNALISNPYIMMMTIHNGN